MHSWQYRRSSQEDAWIRSSPWNEYDHALAGAGQQNAIKVRKITLSGLVMTDCHFVPVKENQAQPVSEYRKLACQHTSGHSNSRRCTLNLPPKRILLWLKLDIEAVDYRDRHCCPPKAEVVSSNLAGSAIYFNELDASLWKRFSAKVAYR
jgi:hypothetical protein